MTTYNPIDKHKLEIERRMNLLEQKLNDNKPQQTHKSNTKRLKQLLHDENQPVYPQEIRAPKTVDLRGKIKPQHDFNRTYKEPGFRPSYAVESLGGTGVIKMNRNQVLVEEEKQVEQKDEKMKQLYDVFCMLYR